MTKSNMFSLVLSTTILCTVFGATLRREQRVVVNDDYQFDWSISEDILMITVTAGTAGYVGFGVSPEGNMNNADQCVFGVQNGSPYLNDYHSQKAGFPTIDTDVGGTSDWILIEASETDGTTTATFTRKLITGDVNFDQPILSGITKVIWAFGFSDSFEYHGTAAGSVDVVFIEE
ncbi:DBH-like monooxygenase protein 1 homolog [Artemia franciscana]|uniref:DBH-like monooxygenase protein 1 homolog n=1 Tax=Artemia franciscana TaxID=6661 RepID=UPI0032DACD85